MAATAAQAAQLRRMTNEVDDSAYSDTAIKTFIEKYPLIDGLGNDVYLGPADDGYEYDELVVNPDWIATYDLNAAAADVWAEKAAKLAGNFDFSAGGQTFNRSQAYNMFMQQSRYYRSRRATTTVKQMPFPKYNYEDDLSDDDLSN